MNDAERKPEMDEAQIIELIQNKASLSGDANWIVAFMLMRINQSLNEIADELKLRP
jgi:hypothetical protein